MGNAGDRTRFMILLAVGAVLIATGFALMGSMGGTADLALGAPNDAGNLNTSLRTNSTGDALFVTQNGAGVAIRASTGIGTGIAGAFTSTSGTPIAAVVVGQNGFAVYAGNDSGATGSGGAVRADGQQNAGVVATSDRRSAVVATATGAEPAIVASAPSGTAIQAAGDVVVNGSLAVEDGCIGCIPVAIARNGSERSLLQGDAVVVLGLEVDKEGSTILIVGPAGPGDPAVGVADQAVSRRAPGQAGELSTWHVRGFEIAAGDTLGVVTSGIMTLHRGLEGVSAGDSVAVRDTPGDLEVAGRGDVRVGRYLGLRPDGRGVLLVDPD